MEVYTGIGKPTDEIGKNGDLYIELYSGVEWKKKVGSWALSGRILTI